MSEHVKYEEAFEYYSNPKNHTQERKMFSRNYRPEQAYMLVAAGAALYPEFADELLILANKIHDSSHCHDIEGINKCEKISLEEARLFALRFSDRKTV